MGDVSPHRNLFEEAEATLVEAGAGARVRILAPHAPREGLDLLAIALEESGERPAASFASGCIADLRASGRQLQVRCRDERIAAIGAALERGDASVMAPPPAAAGGRYVVGILDQNATKALHLGHLRNIAVGHAVASLLEAVGGETIRQSQIADAGRSMGEALAGWELFADGADPEAAGLKSDHFVGRCYGRYVASLAAAADRSGEATPDAALSREDAEHDDLAEELLARRSAGDADVVELWLRMRAWAVGGQDETLARLGMAFDWRFMESDYEGSIDRLRDAVLDAGVARREPKGGVVYDTGREHYPRLLLNRRDGFPTQHLRYMALWRATRDVLRGRESIQVIGDEWRALTVYADEILHAVADGDEVHPRRVLLHGMVDVDGQTLKSSRGEPPLIDDLLDELAERIAEQPPWSEHARLDPHEAAATVALAACLSQPTEQRLAFDRERLLDERHSPGWAMARALALASHPRHDGPAEPLARDPRYRFLVVRSQAHRQQVSLAHASLEVEGLVRFYAHVARWFLAEEPAPPLARAMRTVVGTGLATLGLAGPVASGGGTHQTGLEPASSA